MTINIINSDYMCVNLDTYKKCDLFIIDPPYGNIIKDKYDAISNENLVTILYDLLAWCKNYANEGATLYIFGGIGTVKNRPFFKFLSEFEAKTDYKLHNFITWKKRRGYGTQYNYLFTREEIAMLVYKTKYPKIFNVPYLNEERSEAWKARLKRNDRKNKQPRSNKLRRTNVFTDITELFTNKLVTAQKPTELIDVLIETSSNEDSLIIDPMAGSGTTALSCKKYNRDCIIIEKDKDFCNIIKHRLEQ